MSKLDDTDERRWVTAQLRTQLKCDQVNVAMGSSCGLYGVCMSNTSVKPSTKRNYHSQFAKGTVSIRLSPFNSLNFVTVQLRRAPLACAIRLYPSAFVRVVEFFQKLSAQANADAIHATRRPIANMVTVQLRRAHRWRAQLGCNPSAFVRIVEFAHKLS